jgi:hypothetical protein
MKRLWKPALIVLALLLAVLSGIVIGDKRGLSELLREWLKPAPKFGPTSPNDPALKAGLPTPDPEAQFPNCPLNALLKPGLPPQEQTGIIGQMLIDYWTTTRTLPNGTWEEVCAQLAGKNREKLAMVPAGHPALGKDSFSSSKDQPGIRLHVIGSSNCVFQLIYDGPDGKPYTDDDLIRNFPPEAEVSR